MAVIPQVVTSDRATGAQVIDGSLKFDGSYLKKTWGSAPTSSTTQTYSFWLKINEISPSANRFPGIYGGNSSTGGESGFSYRSSTDRIKLELSDGNKYIDTSQVFRDTGWYHIMGVYDTSNGTDSERLKLYVNGERVTELSASSYPTSSQATGLLSNSYVDQIGSYTNGTNTGDFNLSQFYGIDGLALGPGYFGFTDPLTNIWKPKKFRAEGTTVNDGRVFSSTGTFSNWDDDGSYPKTELFDGTLYTGGTPNGATSDTTGEATFDFGDQRITGFQNLQINIFLSSNQASATNVVSVNGVDITNECHQAGNNTWTTVDLGNKFTSLQSFRIANYYIYVGGFIIDGVVMQDSTTQNLDFGTNGFYLPMDGNSPIGQDKSGKGNDWTPVNFGNSLPLDNPSVSGARPILNTTQGGTQATVGVFGSKENKTYVTTTANGSVYQFDITSGDNPSLEFIRGATYKFDYSAHSSHGVLFSSTNPDSSTTAYTTGTSTSGNVISFTVPHDAPDTLYYYCVNHPTAMNGAISVTTDETKADKYAANCVLALPLVGGADDLSGNLNCTTTSKTTTVNNATVSNLGNFYTGSFDFDGTDDEIVMSSSSDFTFGTGDLTIEMWAYTDVWPATFWDTGAVNSHNNCCIFADASYLYWYMKPGTDLGVQHVTSGLQTGRWNHLAFVRSGSTAKMYLNGQEIDSETNASDVTTDTAKFGTLTGYNYDTNGQIQDVRVYKGVAKYTSNFVVSSPSPDILPDTPSGVAGGSKLTKITDGAVSFDGTGDFLNLASSTDFGLVEGDWTVECYAYITGTNGTGRLWYLEGNASNIDGVYFSNTNMSMGTTGVWSVGDGTGGDYAQNKWIHVAVCHDSTNMRMYIDGVQTLTTTNNFYNASSKKLTLMSTNNGSYSGLGEGFISNFRVVNGTALYTANFTPPTRALTNVTNTKLLCCQSNTSATEAAVTPGSITANGDAAATNFNPFNTDINTVRGQETGYATLNPLRYSGYTTSNRIFTDGNLRMLGRGDGVSNFGVTTGKFYAEVFVERIKSGESGQGYIGVIAEPETYAERGWPTSKIAALRDSGGGASNNFYGDGKGTTTTTWTEGDTISVAFDADAAKVWIAKNGQYINGGNPATGVTPSFSGLTFKDYYFLVSDNKPSSSETTDGNRYQINFGQKPFKFSPPDGFQPLNLANTRPETVIARPDKYVGITTWKGDDQASHVINDLNFDGVPDFVWIKRRDGNSVSHQLYDTIRGATKPLVSSSTAVEDTQTSGLKAFVRNGFELGASSVVNGLDGDNGNVPFNYVAWCWKAGGSKGTFNIDDVSYASAAAAGLDGGLTVTGASVGTKQGFSIIKATGSDSQNSFKHGLGKVPKFVIAKDMDNSRAWYIYHGSLGANYRGSFDGAQFTSDSEYFGSGMTDTLVTLKSGGSGGNNYNGANMIYYVWADVPGLQKFGTYSGNSNADGPFIELGFRPALFVMKQTDSTGYWMVYDSARDPINNGSPYYLFWNDNSAHGTGYDLDFLSNGVKLRTNNANFNTTSYVYMAWAEAPTIDLYGGGASAR